MTLSGCAAPDLSFAPPEQRVPFGADDRSTERSFLDMKSDDTEWYLVSGVNSGPKNDSRWTRDRSILRFLLQDTEDQNFRLEFFLPREVLSVTGPATVTVSINGKQAGRHRVETDGIKTIDTPVPSALLREGENIVSMFIEPGWTTADGHKLGFVLMSAGFVD